MEHHVKMIEMTIDYGYFSCDKIALFDERDIDPEYINRCIKGDVDSDCFILITPRQYENVFRSLKGK